MEKSIFSALVAWLPLLVLLAGAALMFRRDNGDNVAEVMKSNAELVAVKREMARTLTDIRILLEGRKS